MLLPPKTKISMLFNRIKKHFFFGLFLEFWILNVGIWSSKFLYWGTDSTEIAGKARQLLLHIKEPSKKSQKERDIILFSIDFVKIHDFFEHKVMICCLLPYSLAVQKRIYIWFWFLVQLLVYVLDSQIKVFLCYFLCFLIKVKTVFFVSF